ncbi:Class E vacuolar protein-sorting machinery protein HSE1 [Smittium culicis]|uniref:Class E vacuolar protein-sorting machinery protein HSE1 n=1 Tax=Smittium culicis TaxID=133412 RepID=A0A1R1XWD8_9FUNG|nr:Class E vacuolar protein-sorting machinery protein HSE1 [Smittium culicis]
MEHVYNAAMDQNTANDISDFAKNLIPTPNVNFDPNEEIFNNVPVYNTGINGIDNPAAYYNCTNNNELVHTRNSRDRESLTYNNISPDLQNNYQNMAIYNENVRGNDYREPLSNAENFIVYSNHETPISRTGKSTQTNYAGEIEGSYAISSAIHNQNSIRSPNEVSRLSSNNADMNYARGDRISEANKGHNCHNTLIEHRDKIKINSLPANDKKHFSPIPNANQGPDRNSPGQGQSSATADNIKNQIALSEPIEKSSSNAYFQNSQFPYKKKLVLKKKSAFGSRFITSQSPYRLELATNPLGIDLTSVDKPDGWRPGSERQNGSGAATSTPHSNNLFGERSPANNSNKNTNNIENVPNNEIGRTNEPHKDGPFRNQREPRGENVVTGGQKDPSVAPSPNRQQITQPTAEAASNPPPEYQSHFAPNKASQPVGFKKTELEQFSSNTQTPHAPNNDSGREALYDYNAEDEVEISLYEDCVVEVLEIRPDGWWRGSVSDKTTGETKVGLFPSNYTSPIT